MISDRSRDTKTEVMLLKILLGQHRIELHKINMYIKIHHFNITILLYFWSNKLSIGDDHPQISEQ